MTSAHLRHPVGTFPPQARSSNAVDHTAPQPEHDRAALVAAARRAAEQAALAAAVQVDDVHDVSGFEDARQIFDAVWRPDPGDEPMTRGLLNALVHAGNYCAIARTRAGVAVGASAGFFGNNPVPLLHSHITGVLPGHVGGGVGLALKLHQRWWALQVGLEVITWTFDPLIRRNAYFNANKLGALPVEYLVDFYGDMNDGINAGQGSDRLLCWWDLVEPAISVEPEGSVVDILVEREGAPVITPHADHINHGDALLGVGIPADVESLRYADPVLAAHWRMAVRGVLGSLLREGGRVVGVSRDGRYLVRRTDHRTESPEVAR